MYTVSCSIDNYNAVYGHLILVSGERSETTVLQGSKKKCFIPQLIHLLSRVSIRAAFFIKIYYL